MHHDKNVLADKTIIRDHQVDTNLVVAGNLSDQVKDLEKETGKVKRKYWWENAKCWIFIAVAALVIVYSNRV